jgi:DNA polymerase-4
MKRKTWRGKPPGPAAKTLTVKAMRTIIHVDMDAFYASVERLDQPELKGLPVVVGGLGARGVVATASYEARKFGVHSAMPMGRARRLCPDARFIRPRMERYRAISREVFCQFREFTPLVEGLSLDEAFLDVSDSLKLFGSPDSIGARVKALILEATGLTASVGVAHNKFLAKLASDACKPDGLLWIKPDRVKAFLDPMPISRLWGIGRKTEPKLRALGILTIGQLRVSDPAVVRPVLGNRSEHFLRLSRGEDQREVVPESPDKSISHENTFDRNLTERAEMLAELQRQAEQVAGRLRRRHLLARTVTVKIRDSAFHTVTRSRSMRFSSDSTRTLYRMARALFESWRENHRATPVRLLGMGVSGFEDADRSAYGQGEGTGGSDDQKLDRVVDQINTRFGQNGMTHAQTLRRKK